MDQTKAGVHLERTDERAAEVEALAAELGGAVGLPDVLADLDRAARPVPAPGRSAPAALGGFRWNTQDHRSSRWWPQGITSSADASESGLFDGRAVLCTSAYSHEIDGIDKGARVSFVDLDTLRYRHVLLVVPVLGEDGAVDLEPAPLHAGGIVWHGPFLHVAGTSRGVWSFRLSDIVRVDRLLDASLLGRTPAGLASYGYRYLLPLRFAYTGVADPGVDKLRYSFLSLDRTSSPFRLLAGEYGRGSDSTRLAGYAVDPGTALLEGDRRCSPGQLKDRGVPGMQGATIVEGQWFVTTSAGRHGQGSLYVGEPGAFRRFRRVLPAGVEDLTYWPSTDHLWSLTEYPARRLVFMMERSRFA